MIQERLPKTQPLPPAPPSPVFLSQSWGLPLFQLSLVFLATWELLRVPESDQLAVFNFASG